MEVSKRPSNSSSRQFASNFWLATCGSISFAVYSCVMMTNILRQAHVQTTAPPVTVVTSSLSLPSQAIYKVPQCKLQQLQQLENVLGDPEERTRRTSCPDNEWLKESYYRMWESAISKEKAIQLPRTSFVALNIGCNKGFDAVELMRMGTANSLFDVANWRQALIEADAGVLIPACPREVSLILPNMTAAESTILRPSLVEVHCVEPMQATFSVIDKSADKLGLKHHGFILSQAAIALQSGRMQIPAKGFGDETPSLSDCKIDPNIACRDVPVYSLDEYVSEFVHPGVPIDVLLIDAEGYDFDILLGSQENVLSRTNYLEFEFHFINEWGKNQLSTIIEVLHHHNFICYWAGKGELYRITNCWNDSYDKQSWSNVACVKNTQINLAKTMEELFLHFLAQQPLPPSI